jgi:localization factor PodJL
MKSGFTFNLKDMDAETRSAITEAARLSGVTVADWLKRVMAEKEAAANAEQPASSEAQAASDLARSMQALTGRIAAMDEASRSAISALPVRLDAIEQHIGRLSTPGRSKAERSCLIQETAQMVRDLAREIDNADEQARSMIEGLPSRTTPDRASLEEAIGDLDRRIAAMQQRAATPEVAPSRSLSLDEIQDRLNVLLEEPARAARSAAGQARRAPQKQAAPSPTVAIDATLRALEERIDEARSRFDRAAAIAETQPPAATIEHIQRIEQRLTDIAERLVTAENDRRKPSKEAEIASAVREIALHQQSLDDRAETVAMRRDQKALAASIAALRADLSTLSEQVSAISRVGMEGHGAVFEMAHRLDSMAAERPFDRNMLESMREEIESMRALVEGSARQDTLGTIDARSEGISACLEDLLRMVPDRMRLDQLSDEVASLRRKLESDDSPRAVQRLEMHVAELGRSIDAALSSRHMDPLVERLEKRLDTIAGRMETLTDPSAQIRAIHTIEQRLEGRITEIAEKLGNFLDPAPQTAAIRSVGDKIDGRLTDISLRLGGLIETTPQTIDMEAAHQRFEASIAAIGDRLGGMVEKATRPHTEALQDVQRKLEDRFAEISERLSGISENAQERAALTHMQERLHTITDRIDRLNASQKEPSPALDAIKSEIGALRKEVAVGQIPPSEIDAIRGEIGALREEVANKEPVVDTSHLEAQIQQLARQLQTVSTARHDDEPGLAALEAQVTRLATDLERARPQTGALHQVEQTLDRVQAALASTKQESIATARAEARKAVAELSDVAASTDADSALIRGLMQDLESLKSAAVGTEVTTQVRLESVSQTMNHVVERLERLETEATPAPAAQEVAPEPRLDRRADNWRATFDQAADGIPEPVVVPRKGRPGAPAAERASAAVTVDFKSAQRRADFIAAARRAAQAVAEEAAREKAEETDIPAAMDPAEDKPGAFARISQAIRNRRRPLLLAAAAIVLAIGTVQLYGKYAPVLNRSSLMASARSLLSGKSQDRLLSVVRAPAAVPASPAPVVASAAPAPETNHTTVRQILDTTAAASASATSVPDALIPPSTAPTRQITFAQPDTLVGHFSSGDASDVAPTPALAPPAAPRATPLPMATAGSPPVILTSAATATPAADTGLDPAIGPQKLITAASAGNADAEFEVATRYAEGANVPADLAKAAVWYAKAADGGNAIAQYRLASLYERGQGVTKNLVSAVNWYQRAADQGNVNAMHNLAVLLSEGADSGPDHAKALQWFLAAANYGVRDSQYNLGVIYARGLGSEQDLGQSYKWFAIAAAQGDADAATRRDEVGKAMSADDLAKARAAVTAWRAKTPLVEPNAIAKINWEDGSTPGVTVADQQALVAKIQTLLADAGYDPGPADGRLGRKTVDAVRAYQQKAGMPVTGQIDRTLVASLSDGSN